MLQKIKRKIYNFLSESFYNSDYILITIVFVLVVFGIIMLASATGPKAFEKFNDSYWFVRHQLIYGIGIGLVSFFIAANIDYRFWKKKAFSILIFSIILLLLVFVPHIGSKYGHARSWINIFGFSLQPSEIIKLTFLMYFCAWLEANKEKGLIGKWNNFKSFVIIIAIVSVLILIQPDMGTMSILLATSLIVYFIAGANIFYLSGFVSLAVVSLLVMIHFTKYQANRFTAFLHPELDPMGIGYHINQALLAIGSGGIFGRGLTASRQKFNYLPQVAADSIFAVIAEEMGFIVCVILIMLFILLFYRGIKIAMYSKDEYGKLLSIGIVSWIIIQVFINIGGMINLMPMTGVPLPFISYGGTAMVVNLTAMGILVNISKQET